MPRIAMQTAMRAAAVAFLTDYAGQLVGTPPDQTKLVKLQVYPARPASIHPPTGFVDGLSETLTYTGLTQRHPTAEIVVIHGLFDSKDAADQRDAFVDGLIDWSIDRVHQAGANTTVAIVGVEDDATYVPDWLPPDQQKTYYATRISLEGLALTG